MVIFYDILRSIVHLSSARRKIFPVRALTGLLLFTYCWCHSQDSTPGTGMNSSMPISGSALNFDGADDYVTLANPVFSDFTIEYWMKTTQLGDTITTEERVESHLPHWYHGTGIVDADVGGITNDFGTSLYADKLAFGLGNFDYTLFSKSSVNTGQWTHVAVTWKQSDGTMQIIINGNLETTGTSKLIENRHAPKTITLGALNTLPIGDGFFEGILDEVRIWNRVLSTDEIRNNMHGELPSFQLGLVAYYQFNQGLRGVNNAGITTLIDVSGKGNHGTLNNFSLGGTSSNWDAPGAVVTGSISSVYSIYLQWWFILLAVCVFILLIYGVVRLRLRALQRKNKKLEEIISERTSALEISLGEKTALVNEIHHRVKNNLQMVNAMLTMQLNALKDEAGREPLEETNRRISAIGLVHEMLYNNDTSGQISVKEYFGQMVSRMQEITTDQSTLVYFETDIEPLTFNINNCVALGMITSELFSNSIKHAFRGIATPTITVKLHHAKEQGLITLVVQDNGNGLDESQTANGIGFRLIDIFIRQLKGTYIMKNSNGLVFTFEFPHKEK